VIDVTSVSICQTAHRRSGFVFYGPTGWNDIRRRPSKSTGTRRFVPHVSMTKPISLAAA